MKSYDSGGPMVSGHTTPQGGDHDKPVPSEVPPASQPGDPMENWLMKPALEWLEQAEHAENQQRCKMIADLLRDLWRGPSSGTTSAVTETAPTGGTDGWRVSPELRDSWIGYCDAFRSLFPGQRVELSPAAIEEFAERLRALRAEADADQAKDAARWIPVKERLPDTDKRSTPAVPVLFVLAEEENNVCAGRFHGRGRRLPWRSLQGAAYRLLEVTHWMPLPDGPHDEQEAK